MPVRVRPRAPPIEYTMISLESRASFSLENYHNVAWLGEGIIISDEAIAAMLRTNRSLTLLDLQDNKIVDAWKALQEAVEGREGFKLYL